MGGILQAAPEVEAQPLWQGGVPAEAVLLSEAFEGCVLTPYNDGFGFPTIGIGSRRYADGTPVWLGGPAISRATAEALAMRDLEKAAALVAQAVRVPLTPRQAAALILLANNLGALTVAAPSLLKLVHAGDWKAAADLFKIYRTSAGKPATGLRRRRWTEAAFSLGMAPMLAKQKAWDAIQSPEDWPPLPG
ncbi:lysozyme [Roseomonas sp. 18066]|uniref:lysozyme n=1 Tax=Roseomonas sp. 18066 TaxID=2681412 RepID=UPI00135BCD33|nr:lysozyme [Roseomonas sp. 18066]